MPILILTICIRTESLNLDHMYKITLFERWLRCVKCGCSLVPQLLTKLNDLHICSCKFYYYYVLISTVIRALVSSHPVPKWHVLRGFGATAK